MLIGALLCLFQEKELLYEIVSATKWRSYCEIKGRKRQEQKENTKQFVKEKFNLDVSEDEADAVAMGWYAVNNVHIESGDTNCRK